MNTSTQVLVVGGGPAGSTTATLLAREGFDVTLIEKEVFPRYHIGESLLPSCLEILDLIGAREKVEAYGFQRKDGGYFAWGNVSWGFAISRIDTITTHFKTSPSGDTGRVPAECPLPHQGQSRLDLCLTVGSGVSLCIMTL